LVNPGAIDERSIAAGVALARWFGDEAIRVYAIIGGDGDTPDWNGEIGFVPTVVEKASIQAKNAVALVIGPPIMIRFTLPILSKMQLGDLDIYTSLENRMKCGLGNCGPVYVRKDGPVFSLAELKKMPKDY
jgi:sulfhydrogenase subunit gamma (sulfur reductase)